MFRKFIIMFFSYGLTILGAVTVCPDHLPSEIWDSVSPYLLPSNHTAKESLDKIFEKNRVISSLEEMEEAGFQCKKPRTPFSIVAAKHKNLKGYLIKTFLDTQLSIRNEWQHWIQRIRGAKIIEAQLEANRYNALFKVPKKWIYLLPRQQNENAEHRLNFILVVEDMNIVSSKKNKFLWNSKVKKKTLGALYKILKQNYLIDSVYIDNIPFSKDGRIAFIDTEHYNTFVKPLQPEQLLYHLSTEMQIYWLNLIYQE